MSKKVPTVVRSALLPGSALQPLVKDGLGAVAPAHRNYIEAPLRPSFEDSLDIDEGLRPGREAENRWDYLLGHGPSRTVIALEPHSARTGEVDTVIRKKAAARTQLYGHMASGARILHWFWVASGEVQFADTERARRRLDEQGIHFIGRALLAKHLPKPVATPARRRGARRRRRAASSRQ